jgi:hypothetical protein
MLWATPFSNRTQPLDGGAVTDQKEAGSGQTAFIPVLMGDHQAVSLYALWHTSTHRVSVACEPARKGTDMASFQSDQ